MRIFGRRDKKDDSVEQLRRKLILLLTLLFGAVMVTVMVALNLIMSYISTTAGLQVANQLFELDGEINTVGAPSTFRNTDHFAVIFNKEGEVVNIDGVSDDDLTEEYIVGVASIAMSQNSRAGLLKDYNMFYTYGITDRGTLVVLVDATGEQLFLADLMLSTSSISFLGVLMLFVVSFVLANKLVEPVREAFDSQRRFVADASHELKTPIATITANTDILKEQYGDNKWIKYIGDESKRMKYLVNDLLFLASSDTDEFALEFEEFNLSDTVALTAMSFEGACFEAGCRVDLDIERNIKYFGDEQRIKQVIAILFDNAVCHTHAGGTVTVAIKKQVGGKTLISVKNTGDGIPEEERERIFMRFYRSDTSRDRNSGGYGLGLAIARRIIERHKGKITADGVVGEYAEFKILL